MAALTLYTNPMSRGRIARWMLEEVGQPYTVQILDYRSTMKTPNYLAINPMGKVPALVHHDAAGDVVVTEGAAICAYLAEAFPAAGLKPRSGAALASYHRWLFFAAGPVEAAVTNHALRVKTSGREAMVGYANLEKTLAALEHAVTGRHYIAGDRFSAADVYAGSQIGWGMMFGTIPKRQAFATYWARMTNRPAYVRAAALDDADMAKLG